MTERDQGNLEKSLLSLAISSLLMAGSAQAAVITVDTNADGPVGSTPGCTLRSAVASANASISYDGCDPGSVGADQIVFAAGLASSSIVLSEGEIAITEGLSIVGPVADNPGGIVVHGNNASRIFNVTGTSHGEFEVRLEALTLTGGRTTESGRSGGAILSENADIRLAHSLVTGNSTEGNSSLGGGVSVAFGDAIVDHSTISGNSTAGSFSYGAGLAVTNGDLTLSNSAVSGNSTTFSRGAGFFVSGGNAVVTDSLITGNTGTGAYSIGAGLAVSNGNATLINSTVADNTSTGYGSVGGGLYVVSGDAIVNNSTISGNTSGGSGGGIHVASGNIVLTNATVAYNLAQQGADAIHSSYFTSALTLNNSLIVQADSAEYACYADAQTAINSLVTDSSCTGTATDLTDLALGPLQDNGGATPTHALSAGSVARNAAGDCLKDFNILTDQRGEPRPGLMSAACDVGAFEFQTPDNLFRDRFQSD